MAKLIDCGQDSINATLNTGTKGLKSLGETKKYILATQDQKFLSIADFKSESKHDEFIVSKKLVYFFDVESIESANTEDEFLESSINKDISKEGKKINKFRHELDVCSYKALLSYVGSVYTKIYEITAKGYIRGVAYSDGTITGMDLSNFIVSQYSQRYGDVFESAIVEVVYSDRNEFVKNPAVVKADFDAKTKKGVFDATLEIVGTPNTTTIVAKVTSGCCGDVVSGLLLANWKFDKTSDGAPQTIDSVSEVNGVYTFTGTGFESGLLGTDGVINQTSIIIEAVDKLITI